MLRLNFPMAELVNGLLNQQAIEGFRSIGKSPNVGKASATT